MSSPRLDDPRVTEIDRAVWERAMRQLSACTRLLATGLVALGARLVIAGPTPVTVLSTAILALLFLASLLLTRRGRRYQPPSRSSTGTGGRSAQSNAGSTAGRSSVRPGRG
jgi:hypothetical protein